MGGRCQGPTREAFAEGSGPALDADRRRSRHDRPYIQSGVIDTGIYGRRIAMVAPYTHGLAAGARHALS